MGGSIAIIKKSNNKIESCSGWTNSFSSVTRNLEFYKNPENKHLREYFAHQSTNNGTIVPIEYGMFIIDYDSKTIYNSNGYSKYIDFSTARISLDEEMKNDFSSTVHEFFNEGLLCIHSIKCIGQYENSIHQHTYTNIHGMKENFKNVYDICEWLDGKKVFFLQKKRKGNSYIQVDENTVIFNSLEIDLDKLGWKYYEFSEDFDGGVKFYTKLIEDGWEISKSDTDEWANFYERNDDGNLRSFLGILRDKKLTKILNS